MQRAALKSGDILELHSDAGSKAIALEITSAPLGRGSSSIAYEAISTEKRYSCKYRLKELYPVNINGLHRDNFNQLVIGNDSKAEYAEAIKRFEKGLEILWDFAYSDTTGCYTVCPLGKYIGAYGAEYLITQWMPSDYVNSVQLCGSGDLKSAVNICMKTACAAEEFHKLGYINLDIKPENILYSPKMETIAFFDTDTVFRVSDNTPRTTSFSQGAAPEIVNGYTKLYSEKSDVYSIGSMLHRFITGENYYPGQYSVNIAESHNTLHEYAMLKNAAPRALEIVCRIFYDCNSGNPAKRITTSELISQLEQLLNLSLSYADKADFLLNNDEINEFSANMKKIGKADTVLQYFYTLMFIITLFAFGVFCIKVVSPYNLIPQIILILLMLLFKAMIFKRSEEAAISRIRDENCRKLYKTAFYFGHSLNNHQLFEISAPDFIPPTEVKRHRFRLIIGSTAIAVGVITALVSIMLNSFPFLLAAYAIILLFIFASDFHVSTMLINKMYSSKFGTAEKPVTIMEIYRPAASENANNDNEPSPQCIRQIIYNEYKSRCDFWGTVDVISKMLAGVIVIILILEFFPINIESYFRVPHGLPAKAFMYGSKLFFCFLSAATVFSSSSFYRNVKDILFTVYSNENSYLLDKFKYYKEHSQIRGLSFIRGIYNFAIMQFEKGVPLTKLRPAERPTFKQYCLSQNSRAGLYCLLLTIAVLCIVVWHFRVYRAFFPILAVSLLFQVWWYLSGVYLVNGLILKQHRKNRG